MARIINGIDFTDQISVTEVALIFGVHPNTIRRWTAKGLLPFIRLPGGQKRFSRPWCEKAYADGFTGVPDPGRQQDPPEPDTSP